MTETSDEVVLHIETPFFEGPAGVTEVSSPNSCRYSPRPVKFTYDNLFRFLVSIDVSVPAEQDTKLVENLEDYVYIPDDDKLENNKVQLFRIIDEHGLNNSDYSIQDKEDAYRLGEVFMPIVGVQLLWKTPKEKILEDTTKDIVDRFRGSSDEFLDTEIIHLIEIYKNKYGDKDEGDESASIPFNAVSAVAKNIGRYAIIKIEERMRKGIDGDSKNVETINDIDQVLKTYNENELAKQMEEVHILWNICARYHHLSSLNFSGNDRRLLLRQAAIAYDMSDIAADLIGVKSKYYGMGEEVHDRVSSEQVEFFNLKRNNQ